MKTNLENYEERFVDYMEGQLDATEMKEVETFVAQHPELEEDFKLFCSTKLEPDTRVVYTRKESLKQSKTIVRPLFWKVAAAAACIALFIGIGIRFLKPNQTLEQQPLLASLTPIKAQPISVSLEGPALRTSNAKTVSFPKPKAKSIAPSSTSPKSPNLVSAKSITPVESISPVLAITPKPLQQDGAFTPNDVAQQMTLELDERLAAVEPFIHLDTPEEHPWVDQTEQALASLQDSFVDNVRQTTKSLYKQTAKTVMSAYHTADYFINEAKSQLVAKR